jgi:L-tartrate/succinate antiporter
MVGIVLALLPVPAGLTPHAWRYFALFAAVMAGIITEPLPAAAVGLAGVVIAAGSRLVQPTAALSTSWALSGFANGTVWLIFAAYMFALGYSRTGLGKRIALLLIRAMGKRTLGLGYASAFADFALAPFTPSNTSRAGGTIFPIIRHIPELYGSRPGDESARKIGAYLMYNALLTTFITSSLFMTAMAPNVLAVSLVSKTVHVDISWFDWFKAAAPLGIPFFLLAPYLLYKIYPPSVKEAPEAPRWAADELKMMGPVNRKEITLLVLVLIALSLWITASVAKYAPYIDATLVAMFIVVMMLVFKVVSWDDVIGHSQAWNVFIWFATMVTLAGGLADVKFVEWIAKSIAPVLSTMTLTASIVLVIGGYYFLHYLFASGTAHTTSLLPMFLAVAVTIPGLSPKSWALLLVLAQGMSGIFTPFGGGASPIFYGSGFVKTRDFWIYGFVLGVIYFALYLAVAVPWMRFLNA